MSVKSLVSSFQEAKESYQDIRGDYDGMRPSKYVRERNYLGGSADSHLSQSWAQYWRLREYARDMMRNDGIIGQAVVRAADNVCGDGFQLDMLTSDKGLNRTIDDMYLDWANDPLQCDARQLSTFDEIAHLTCVQTDFDGDIFHNPLEEGCLQTVEGDRCVTAQNTTRKVVHGVLLGKKDEPVEYWFAKPDVDNRRMMHIQLVSETYPVAARTSDGEKAIFHMYRRNRFSATRGVPVFAPVIQIAGMMEDLNFAKLVQAQVVSLVAAFLETVEGGKSGTPKFGVQARASNSDGSTEMQQSMAPGKIINLPDGKSLKAFSPNVPNSEFFPHMRHLMRIVGVNLGLPLTLVMLDSSDTNFSGWRAEMDQARVGFKKRQRWLINGLYSPVLRWKIRNWIMRGMLNGPTVNAMLKTGEIFQHKWTPAGWPYIDPSKDATADMIIQGGMLDSPRGIQNRKGRDIDDVRAETIQDNGRTIYKAIRKAQQITEKTQVQVSWRDILNPHGAELTISARSTTEGDAVDDDSQSTAKKKKESN